MVLAAYILVEVEHLLAGDGEEARKKALLHARAEHDRIPLLTKGGFPVVHVVRALNRDRRDDT